MKRNILNWVVILVFLAFFLKKPYQLFGPYFFRQFIIMAFLTLGVSVEMIAGDFDLSFAAQAAASTVLGAFCISRGTGILPAVMLMLVFHMLLGALKGYLMVRFSFPPIIMTLALQTVLTGLLAAVTGENSILFQTGVTFYNNKAFEWLTALTLLALLLLTAFLLRSTYYGKYCRMLGENLPLAEECGLNCTGIAVLVHCFSSLFFFAAAVILMLETSSGSTYLGASYLYKVLAAACIGGVGFQTGEGRVSGMLMGNISLVMVIFLLISNGRMNRFESIIEGAIIVLSLYVQKRRQRTEDTPPKSETARIDAASPKS